MKKSILYVLVLLTVYTSACKKQNNTTDPQENNEVNATIVSSTGTTNYTAKGAKARMKCTYTLVGASNYIDATATDNAKLDIDIIDPLTFSVITRPGTYNISCQYKKNPADPNAVVFSNYGQNNGSVTLTAVNDHYMEGHFTTRARCQGGTGCVYHVDSVTISGTFKGSF